MFFAALADGSIEQVHVQKGVDQLAPPGSFTPIAGISTDAAESANPDVVTRVGMIFNWVPTRILYVTDPLANRILALDISDESSDPATSSNTLFAATQRAVSHVARSSIGPSTSPRPTPEVAARNFASNTTLGGGSDFYVLNRGNNSIVRMTQDGHVVARQQIHANIPAFRVNGLAVSDDARTIWITATAPRRQGVVLRIPAFGAGGVTTSLIDAARQAGSERRARTRRAHFCAAARARRASRPAVQRSRVRNVPQQREPATMSTEAWEPPTTRSCSASRTSKPASFDPLLGRGGPIARQHSIAELGVPCDLPTGIPAAANVISKRSAMTLRGTSLLDNIRIVDIERTRLRQPAAVRGRMNVLADGRVGRFGWKAHSATLVEFMAEALRDELGMTNPLAPDGSRQRVRHVVEARSRRGAADVARRVSQHHRSAVAGGRVPDRRPAPPCSTASAATRAISRTCSDPATPGIPRRRFIRSPISCSTTWVRARRRYPAGLRHRQRIPDDAVVARIGSRALPSRWPRGDHRSTRSRRMADRRQARRRRSTRSAPPIWQALMDFLGCI